MRSIRRCLAIEACAMGLVLAGNAVAAVAHPAARKDVVIPTVYESGHFFAVPKLASGKQMRFMLDTGGGTQPTLFINQTQATTLGLTPTGTCRSDETTYTVVSPAFAPGQAPPDLSPGCHGVVVLPDHVDGQQPVPAGQFVPMYFIGGRWTFDYPGRRVVLRGSGWQPPQAAHVTPLGFKHMPDGSHIAWPRIGIRIDGETIDMLLDTGATAKPTPQSLATNPINTTDGMATGSYIVQGVFDRWHAKHPEWQVLDHGDALSSKFTRTIRVPHVDIAGWDIGPVWFIERPDAAFHDMMGSLMDKPPEGAVGANVFEHFRMTIDYKRGKAFFDCVTGCTATQ